MDGTGVQDSDLIIYVAASVADTTCDPTFSGLIAFAGTCQLESTLDRYPTIHELYCLFLIITLMIIIIDLLSFKTYCRLYQLLPRFFCLNE